MNTCKTHLVDVHLCIGSLNNLKTVANICFVLGYIQWRKILDDLKIKGYFSEGSRSLGKVMSYAVADCETSSPLASFSSCVTGD